jgi:hypothetical protein
MIGYRLIQANQIANKRLKRHILFNALLYPWTHEEINKIRGIFRRTNTRCSCWMCRNERQNEGPTLQERREFDGNVD